MAADEQLDTAQDKGGSEEDEEIKQLRLRIQAEVDSIDDQMQKMPSEGEEIRQLRIRLENEVGGMEEQNHADHNILLSQTRTAREDDHIAQRSRANDVESVCEVEQRRVHIQEPLSTDDARGSLRNGKQLASCDDNVRAVPSRSRVSVMSDGNTVMHIGTMSTDGEFLMDATAVHSLGMPIAERRPSRRSSGLSVVNIATDGHDPKVILESSADAQGADQALEMSTEIHEPVVGATSSFSMANVDDLPKALKSSRVEQLREPQTELHHLRGDQRPLDGDLLVPQRQITPSDAGVDGRATWPPRTGAVPNFMHFDPAALESASPEDLRNTVVAQGQLLQEMDADILSLTDRVDELATALVRAQNELLKQGIQDDEIDGALTRSRTHSLSRSRGLSALGSASRPLDDGNRRILTKPIERSPARPNADVDTHKSMGTRKAEEAAGDILRAVDNSRAEDQEPRTSPKEEEGGFWGGLFSAFG